MLHVNRASKERKTIITITWSEFSQEKIKEKQNSCGPLEKTNDEIIDFDKSSTPAAYKLMTITITEKNEWNNAGKTVPTKGTINKTIV